ncbi:MAG: hypothetical protein ACK56I_19235, partial [bacterium]
MRSTKPFSIVRKSVKKSVISPKKPAPRMRLATRKNGFAASDETNERVGTVRNLSNLEPKKSSIRCGASNTSM